MEKITLTRKELYDLVWTEPLLTLSKKYVISDVGLRKICIKMEIPLPKNGHWQKIQFGKKVDQSPLPAAYSGKQEIYLAFRTEGAEEFTDTQSVLKTKQIEVESDLKNKLAVPDKLTNPDKLIIAARESLNRKDSYMDRGMVYCIRGELDIKVSKSNISRALRLLDSLIKALRARGHDIVVDSNDTYGMVNTQKLKISLREKTKRIPLASNHSWQTYDYQPTGILIIKLDRVCYDKEWIDGKLPLENQLSAIIAKLELTSIELNAEKIIRQKEHEEREHKERLRKAFEQRQKEELAEFQETLQKASRWHKANNLRNYIKEVEARAISGAGISDELKTWLEWAREKVDWYDPFIEKNDELLNDCDKDTLTLKQKSPYYNW